MAVPRDHETGTQLHELSGSESPSLQPDELVELPDDRKKRRCLFLKQEFISRASRWNLQKRYLTGVSGAQDIKNFRAWFTNNYPGVEIHAGDWPKTVELAGFVKQAGRKSEWILNGKLGIAMWLLLVVTAIVGGLTKMQVGQKSHACWLLVWLYGGPAFRWKWLFVHSFDKEPCRSLWKWCIYELCQLLVWLVAFGVYCGITVICVELFAAFCGGPNFTITLGVQYWIAVGISIAAGLLLVGIVIAFSTEILREFLN